MSQRSLWPTQVNSRTARSYRETKCTPKKVYSLGATDDSVVKRPVALTESAGLVPSTHFILWSEATAKYKEQINPRVNTILVKGMKAAREHTEPKELWTLV